MAERMNDLDGKEWLKNSFSIWRDIKKTKEELQLEHPAIFPIALAERLIKIYTKTGDTVLDPFVGIGTTAIAAQNLDRKGIGVDLNEDFIKIAKKRAFNQSRLIPPKFEPEFYVGDSLELNKFVRDNSIDLSISSPPYWDILNQRHTADFKIAKNYSKSNKDLGNIEDYKEFLSQLKNVYSKVYAALKPNKRCCVVVMDIRKQNKFYPLHLDLTNIMREIGFELEEFIIWDRQHEYNNMKTLGYPYVFRINKVHEYICVFLKPKINS